MKKRLSLFPAIAVLVLGLVSIRTANAQSAAKGPRYALVIGNGNYAELGKLKNPVNDATDMAKALGELGFQVNLLTDADLASMEDAMIRLGNQLAQSADSMGFFFYAGHGVQSGGINYLIPADARIASETFLKTKALATQSVLDTLQQSRNTLNVVVLDACRDNPFSWSRSGTRGLTVVGSQPPGSIVAYATSAGSVARDGTGRNGVFTQELLKQIRTPGLEIKEVFNRTGKAVGSITSGKQVPAVYNQFFDSAYLAGAAVSTGASVPATSTYKTPSFGEVKTATGNLSIHLATAGTVSVAGLSAALPAGTVPVNDLPAGSQTVTVRYADGQSESRMVTVPAGGTASVSFTYVPTLASAPVQRAPGESLRGEIYVPGGTFRMGSNNGESDEKPVHPVTVSGFWMMQTEVTVGDFRMFVNASGYRTTAEKEGGGYIYTVNGWVVKSDASWKNPYFEQGENNPVTLVSWYDAIEYANWLSWKDGLYPVYIIEGPNLFWDRSANGWRLPTEAEWEYAARGGPKAQGLSTSAVYAGSSDLDNVAWYDGNSVGKTHPVATKAPNALGLYDMAGNVWEWTNDRYGNYSSGSQTDPTGEASGTYRVVRGGSWGYDASSARSVNRDRGDPGGRNCYQGFRLVRGN